MPVLRENIQTGGIRPGGVVNATAHDAEARAYGEMARGAMRISDQLMRISADMQEQDAIALAREIEIKTDENGVPQVDRSVGDRLSIMARRSFDRVLDQRYEQRLAGEVASRMADARSRNPLDPEAFSTEAGIIAEEMSRAVPEAFKGVYGDFVRHYTLSNGGKVTWAKNQMVREHTVSEWVANSTLSTEAVLNLTLANDADGAREWAKRHLEVGQDLLRRGLITPKMFQDSQSAMAVAIGEGLIQNMIFHAEDVAADPVKQLHMLNLWIEKLERHDQDAVGILPDKNARLVLASRLRAKAAELDGDRRSAAKAAEAERDIHTIRSGGGNPDSTADQKTVDDVLTAVHLSATPWASGIDLDFWLHVDENGGIDSTSTAVWDEIRRTGIIPMSMREAMNSLPNRTDPADRLHLFKMWRNIQNGRAMDGLPLTVYGLDTGLDPKVIAAFRAGDLLLETGRFQDEAKAIETAMQYFSVPEDEAFDTLFRKHAGQQMDPKTAYGYRISSTGSTFADDFQNFWTDWFVDRPVDGAEDLFKKPESFERDLETYIGLRVRQVHRTNWLWKKLGISKDGNIPASDVKQIATTARFLLQSGAVDHIDVAAAHALHYYSRANPRTGVLFSPDAGRLTRSSQDPFHAWRVPESSEPHPDEGYVNGTWAWRAWDGFKEAVVPLFAGPEGSEGILGEPKPDSFYASWWEREADLSIRRHLTPEMLGEDELPEFLEAGKHYVLEAVGDNLIQPRYMVWYRDPDRGWLPLQYELDLGMAHRRELARAADRAEKDLNEARERYDADRKAAEEMRPVEIVEEIRIRETQRQIEAEAAERQRRIDERTQKDNERNRRFHRSHGDAVNEERRANEFSGAP